MKTVPLEYTRWRKKRNKGKEWLALGEVRETPELAKQ